MNYNSTRNKKLEVTASRAINDGISKEGGLFVPENIPVCDKQFFDSLVNLDYIGRAKKILPLYLTDFSEQEIESCVMGAYNNTFDENNPAPVKKINEKEYVLELWHGPTCAFKDMALQILPRFLTFASKHTGDGNEIVILVATSGDTGKAALEGFKDVENTKIIVFYPEKGVSATQKLQMATQTGQNVFVCAINGNFDDAQSNVKRIFTDNECNAKLNANKMAFSSANSINWGRLLPQVVYYVSAYCDLIKQGADLSDGFNVCVPTGNFGNILAAYYAKQMGVPIRKLICASNKNNVLTDFINTGVYDKNRKFYTTISPSMDILISSNLERLLYHITDCDDNKVSEYMNALSKEGKYEVDDRVKEVLSSLFYAGCCDDEQTKATVNKLYKQNNYLCDTHTAVAYKVYEEYTQKQKDNRPCVIVSTASAYKFASDVLNAVDTSLNLDGVEAMNMLQKITDVSIPAPLKDLDKKPVRFKGAVEVSQMDDAVFGFLGI